MMDNCRCRSIIHLHLLNIEIVYIPQRWLVPISTHKYSVACTKKALCSRLPYTRIVQPHSEQQPIESVSLNVMCVKTSFF